MTLDELKNRILTEDLEDFINSVLLAPQAPHFSDEQIRYVARKLTEKYSVPITPEQIYIVGSSKLGFALFEKRQRDGTTLPRFRQFRPDSDVDLAIVCPALFDIIWLELSGHAVRQPWMPWNSNSLGDYLIYGWIRPDHFPKHVRLARCDDWWDTFRSLSASPIMNRRAIRGGLYYSVEHLKKYQLRGLNECKLALESINENIPNE